MYALKIATAAAAVALGVLSLSLPATSARADETAATASPVAADETLWASIKDLSMPDLLEEFIKRYPDSPHRAEAEAKLAALKSDGNATSASDEAAKLLDSGETAATAPEGGDASLTRDVAAETAAGAVVDPALAGSIVAELERMGCEPGPGDGTYGDTAKAAVARFATSSGLTLDSTAPTPEMLSVLKLGGDDVCRKAVAEEAAPAEAPAVQPAAKVKKAKVVTKRRKPSTKSATIRKAARKSTQTSQAKSASKKVVAKARKPARKKTVVAKKKTAPAAPATTSSQSTVIQASSNGGGNGNGGGGSGGGGGGGTGGGGGWSDARVKTAIAAVGKAPNGLTLYRFAYIWGGGVQVGVMAQDVIGAGRPDAVTTMPSGLMRVDYAKLGLKMATLPAWQSEGLAAVTH